MSVIFAFVLSHLSVILPTLVAVGTAAWGFVTHLKLQTSKQETVAAKAQVVAIQAQVDTTAAKEQAQTSDRAAQVAQAQANAEATVAKASPDQIDQQLQELGAFRK